MITHFLFKLIQHLFMLVCNCSFWSISYVNYMNELIGEDNCGEDNSSAMCSTTNISNTVKNHQDLHLKTTFLDFHQKGVLKKLS